MNQAGIVVRQIITFPFFAPARHLTDEPNPANLTKAAFI
jgi:hypothetical protein